MAGGSEYIGVDESADSGVIITGVQVVEPGFVVVVVAAVTEGVYGCQFSGSRKDVAPGIVGVGCHEGIIGRLIDFYHITLQVLDEVVSALQVVQSGLYFVDEAISVFPAKLTSVFP